VKHDPLLDRVTASIGDRYLIESELGRGGMAVVYGALDTRLNRRVAIKVLPPDLAFNADVRERFLREAQTAAQLSHPSIVPIYTVDETNAVVFFVMALVDGESLGERLERRGVCPPDEVQRVLHDVADALDYAHRNGVVHRDIKPDNIIIDRASGRPVVTDFGIARAMASDSRLTVTGVAMGTPKYMSPEQALGEREVDGRSDIYSLAVVGYQMLTGSPPFTAGNTPALLMKHVSERPRPLHTVRPGLPEALVGAITRSLAKQPEERWRDAGQFRDALSGIGAAGAVAVAVARKANGEVEPMLAGDPERLAEAATARRSRAAPPIEDRSLRDLPRRGFPPLPPLPGSAPARSPGKSAKKAEGDFDERPVEQRVTIFRRKLAGNAVTIATLAGINFWVSPEFLWFLFPTAFMSIDVLSKAGSLWADGVRWREVFGRRRGKVVQRSQKDTADGWLAAKPRSEVLAGPHGKQVRRAADNRAAILEVVARLSPGERQLIPDVLPTVDALAERVVALATTLQRLDTDVSGASLGALDSRIAGVRQETPTVEQERRLELLERQRATLAELLERRRVLAGQIESAGLALENLKLDLYKLRSAGFSYAVGDVTSATQQARLVSREIGYVLEAGEELRG
jgi:serine/threonine protein kinase